MITVEMLPRCVWFALLAFATSAVAADTVLLENGNRLEGVVVEVEESRVRILYSYGEMSVPRTAVASVVREESSLEHYFASVERLQANPSASAEDWITVAVQARSNGLDDAYRRSILRAAEIEPAAPELAEHMRRIDHVYDESRDRWVPYRAPVVPVAEPVPVVRDAAAEVRRERERLLDALELLALAQFADELEEQARRRGAPAPWAGHATLPFAPVPVIRFVGAAGWPDTPANRETLHYLTLRQPGGLLPVVPGREIRSSFQRASERP